MFYFSNLFSICSCSLGGISPSPSFKNYGCLWFPNVFFFPSCVFSLDLYSHRHSITVLNVQQPSKMFYFRLIHWHEFDLISSFKVVYPLSGWIRHMWVSWFSFSACSQQSYVFPHFQMKNKGATLHSSLSQTTSNPSAKSFGFTFKLYLHFHHFSIHCLISIESILISSDLPELTLQVSLLPLLKISIMSSIHIICSQTILMKHTYYDVHCANPHIRALAWIWPNFCLQGIYPLSGWIRHYTCHNAKQSQTMDSRVQQGI